MAHVVDIFVGHEGTAYWPSDQCPGTVKQTVFMPLQMLSSGQSGFATVVPAAVRVNGAKQPVHSEIIIDLCEGRLCARRRVIAISLLQQAGVTGLWTLRFPTAI